jgi:hypothetical protein
VELAKADGYSATKEEAKKYLEAHGKLNDLDLAEVAGGILVLPPHLRGPKKR